MTALNAQDFDRAKVISAAKRLAADIGVHWPLPKAERESLAAIVLKAAERSLVPLAPATGRDPAVRIADDGRFEVAFVLDPAFVKLVGTGDPVIWAMIRAVSEAVAFSKEWVAGPRETLVYKSSAAHTFLIRPEMPAAEELARLGLSGLPKCPVLKNLCAAFIEAGKLASINDADRARKVAASLAASVPVSEGDINGKKFKGLVEDRDKWTQLDQDILMGDEWDDIEHALQSILLRVEEAKKKLVKPDKLVREQIARYFSSHERWVIDSIVEYLDKASSFLAAGQKSRYRHASGYKADTGNEWPQSHGRGRVVALEYRGFVYIHPENMSYHPGELPLTLLHEALHLYVGGNSAGGGDYGYRGESILEQLTVNQALHNPDSYVALIEILATN